MKFKFDKSFLFRGIAMCLILVSVFFVSFYINKKSAKSGNLAIKKISEAQYQSSDNKIVSADFYALSDDSLFFVKIVMPDKHELTLVRAVSASGVRYIDMIGTEFFVKQDTAIISKTDYGAETAQDVVLFEGTKK